MPLTHRTIPFALTLGLSAIALAVAASGAPTKVMATKPATDGEKMRALFAASDEANLKRNPISALFRGDMRYADRLGDYMTDAYFNAERAASQQDLRNLLGIKRAALNPTDQIAYDVFEQQTRAALKGYSPAIMALTVVRPMDHFGGFHTFYPSFASGQGAAPFKTVLDYDNNLKRHRDYATLIDNAIMRFRQGMTSGVVQPKLTVVNMIEQLDGLIAEGVEKSTFYGPVTKFPDGISAADKTRLTAAYGAIIRDVITPAHTRLRDFFKTEYLPVARDSVGLIGMKGGAALYTYMIEQSTTLPLTADYVHNLGLSEVARIRGEMEKIRVKVGFKGTLAEFFVHLRTDPQFKPKTKDELVNGYYAIGKTVDARIRDLFSTIPKTPLEIRFYEAYREKNQAGGSYEQGVWDPKTPANNRPGIFYFNTYDLPSRTTPGMETLFLHEAAPGHHFQISLAQENDALPAFMRYGGNTAYVEGWALYAETLYDELGMETDPYRRFGGLDDEMLRAMRLVVDSGIHAKGWSRDKAIKYMLDNSSMGETDAKNEVERYIVWPGQALAYKIGQLTILRLRDKAEKALGSKFDIKDFHAQVLMTGALPMTVLEKKINGWIAAKIKG
jgi:uncharacterized protein (DUF885 family)